MTTIELKALQQDEHLFRRRSCRQLTDPRKQSRPSGWGLELAKSTDSQLHVLSVGMLALPDYAELLEEAYRRFERHGQQTLGEQVKKVEEAAGSYDGAR